MSCRRRSSSQYKESRRFYQPDKGYSSHGSWSSLGEIRAIEHERGNPFPRLPYPNDTPAIWLCPTRRKALRYLVLAEDWERVDESQPLTQEEQEMLEDIVEDKLKETDKAIHEDPDEGFLVIRPSWKRWPK